MGLLTIALVASVALAAGAAQGASFDPGVWLEDRAPNADARTGSQSGQEVDGDHPGTGEPAPAPDDGRTPSEIPELEDARDDDPEVGGSPTPTPALARLGGLELSLPSGSPIVVGFHEASSTDALALEPVGRLTDDRNPTKFDAPDDDPDGSRYLVLSSRGRVNAASSAVDIVLDDDDPVRSPVDGTVTRVERYRLYGQHPDLRVEIAPVDAPELRVVLIHLAGARVEVGDRVGAGRDPVAASVRKLDFSSHIDRETEPERFGHVHLEVKRAQDLADAREERREREQREERRERREDGADREDRARS